MPAEGIVTNYAHGMSADEIAEVCELPAKGVRSLLAYAVLHHPLLLSLEEWSQVCLLGFGELHETALVAGLTPTVTTHIRPIRLLLRRDSDQIP